MAPRYHIRLKDQAGILVAEFDHFLQLTYQHKVNGVGWHRFEIEGSDARANLFDLDGRFEVWRSNQDWGLDWYLEYEGFHRTPTRETYENGYRAFVSYGPSYLDLISRRLVAWFAETAGSDKSGLAETVIKAYVNENAGPGATVAAGRAVDGVTPGLAVQADAAGGAIWNGARAWQNLLDVIQGIGLQTDYAFDVIGTGPATFEFRTYADQRGADRSVIGLDPTTGLNGAGNRPVIFSIEGGTMARAGYSMNRGNEVTSVIVLGRGSGSNRSVRERTNGLAMADSPWNRREMSRNASNETEQDGLDDVGDRLLEENAAAETLAMVPLQTESQFYGSQYTWGDLVTMRYAGIERQKEIVSITVSVGEDGESLTPELADVPT